MKLQRHNLAMQWILRRRTNEVKGKANPLYNEFKKYQSALSDGFEGTMNEYMMGQQVKDGGRIEMKPGGIVEPGVVNYGKKTPDPGALLARERETKELMKVRKSIDTWTKNWLNKNIDNYEIRELDKFKKDLGKAWQKELKANPKKYVTTMRGGSPFKPTSVEGLSPNVSDKRFGKTPFKYLGEEVGDKLTIKTFWNKIFYHNQLKDKAFKKKTVDWMNHFVAGKAHVNQHNRKAYEAKTAKLLDDDVIYFLSKDSGLDGHTRKAVMNRAFPEVNPAYRAKMDKMSNNYKISEGILDEYFGKKNILSTASTAEHKALAKIFDVSELPKSLRYSMDHIYGISEAVREIQKGNPNRKFVQSILDNVQGMSAKKNSELGTKWYSFQRKNLANKIEKGINAEASLQKLNKLTKNAYGVDNAYQVVKGNVRPTKSFVGQTQPERFASYFKEIAQTKEGSAAIKKQYGSLKNLLQGFCNYGKSGGGRVSLQGGSCPTNVAARNFARASEDLVQGRVTGKAGQELAKKIGTVSKAGSKGMFSKLLGPYGIGLDVVFEAGMIGTDVLKGKPLNEAVADNWITGAAYKTFTGKTGEKLLNERLAKMDSSTKIMGNAMNLSSEVEDLNKELARMEADRQVSTTNLGKKEIEKIKAEIAQKTKEFNTLTKNGTLIEPGTPAYESYYNRLTELRDSERAKSIYSKIGDATVTDFTSDRYVPREKAETVLPENYSTFKPNLLTQDQLLNYAKEQNINVTPQQADEFIVEDKWRQLFEQPGMKGTQDKFFNAGGRVSFSGGGIDKGRRTFLKILAALGIGTAGVKSGVSLFSKAVGKKTAVTAGADIVTNTQGMPSWFPALVNKIIREGDDVTKKLGTVEREVVHTKKLDSKDVYGDEVTVYRNLDTGDIRVEVDSVSNMGEAPIQLDYKAPSVIDSGKSAGKKTKPEFSAVESEPRVANWDGDIEFDGENIVGSVDDLFSDTTKLKNYAEGKKPTMKDFITNKKKTDKVKKINEDTMEQIDYIEGRQGGPGSIEDDLTETARVSGAKSSEADPENLLQNFPDKYFWKDKKASGGRVNYDTYLPGIDDID